MSTRTEQPRLALSPRFSHVVEYEEGLVLVGDEDSTVLTGSSVAELVALLDGNLSAPEIAARMLPTHPRDEVRDALRRLRDEDIVRVVDDSAELFGAAGGRPGTSGAEGEAGGGFGSEHGLRRGGSDRQRALARAIREAWRSCPEGGMTLVPVRDPRCYAWYHLLVTDDYLRPEIGGWNRRALETGRPFLIARLAWDSVWLGPWVVPRWSACGKCLEERLRLNLGARSLLYSSSTDAHGSRHPSLQQNRDDGPVRVRTLRPPASPDAVARLACLVEDRVGREKGVDGLRDTLVVRRRGSREDEEHTVERLPHCPHCGNTSEVPPRANIRVSSRKKVNGPQGGYRSEEARVTLARFEQRVSPLTGVVRVVEKVPAGNDDIVHVYTANHAVGGRPVTLRAVTADYRDHSGGKGATDVDARVSALCEAMERVSAGHRGTEPERFASQEELGDSAVPPNDILCFSDNQYARRDALNDTGPPGFHWIPEPYRSSGRISWTAVRSLVSGACRLVPSAAVYLGFQGAGSEHCRADSNGLAAGNCVEEAILQGFLELVERDAVAIWWYNRLRRPGVDLESFHDPWIEAAERHHTRIGRELWALDITADLGIPCFAAFSAKPAEPTSAWSSRSGMGRGPRSEEIILGFGAHLEAAVALRRAVAEVNQMLPTVLTTPTQRREQLLPDFRDALEWLATATRVAHPHVVPDPSSRPRGRSDFAKHRTGDLRDDIERCVSIVRERGMDLLACDLTRRDIGLSVVRVMVPGLRHFWRRLGPGRLYDVPVALGLRDEPTPEAEMNPVSMFV